MPFWYNFRLSEKQVQESQSDPKPGYVWPHVKKNNPSEKAHLGQAYGQQTQWFPVRFLMAFL